ncbi:MAG TPA: N-acetyltransferase [Caulobacteraceae bacterium]|nr:N-acetyltransferase [Caulobacteraceae bacterium]
MRSPTPADYDAIRVVVRAAFDSSRFDEATIVEGVRAERRVLVELVAEAEGAIVGHVLFSRMRVEPPRLIAGLGPVAVAPPHQRQGIGNALCRAGIEAVRAMGAEAVVVLGHPEYYPRFGFSHALAAPLTSPFADREAFMGLELTPGALTPPLKVDYPAAFG